MSDTPQGESWWYASDGKWYPPAGPHPPASTGGAASPAGANLLRNVVIGVVVVCIVLAVPLLAIIALSLTDEPDRVEQEEPANPAAATITADTECDGVYIGGEVPANRDRIPDLQVALLQSSLCNERREIRGTWPAGITIEAATAYMQRVCAQNGAYIAVPQEWYTTHPGPTLDVDLFAEAIQQHVRSEPTLC